jgi:HAE1 family hydrophobic/amphiphilic exporter-1
MISKFFVERPIFANVIAIVTIIIGAVCFYLLPVSQYPPVTPPTIQVTTRYPGASAETVAATVGIPIEQAVNGVENSLYMSSTSASDGSYTLTVTFAVGTDLNIAVALVQNLTNSALAQLPAAAVAQGVTVKKVSTDFLLVISLYSEEDRFDETYLSNYAVINLQNPLARLPGVGLIRVVGAGPYSMRVWLDPNRLQYYNLTTEDVMSALRRQNVQVAAGQLGGAPSTPGQAFQFTMNTLGRLADGVQFEDIIVKSERGATSQLVRIRDVARVELSQQNYSNFAGVSGHKSSQTIVYTLPGANALETGNIVKKAMADLKKDFPQGLTYAIYYDTTIFVRQAINEVYRTLFEAGILVLIVILVFLQNWRGTLVPATTIPVTIIGAFAAMKMMGFTINLMTLFALVLAIGIVVDDAIIIVENAAHYIEQGLNPKDATIKAMKELTGPVFGITLALVSVFLPAAFLPGITGQIFRQFALVVASTAVISAINALTLKPAQCALWLRPQGERRPNRFYQAFNRVYLAMENAYVRLVGWMVHRTRMMMGVFLGVIFLTGWLFALHPTGFLPQEDQGYAIVPVRLVPGASQDRVREVAAKVAAILKEAPGIRAWVTIGGFSILDAAYLPNVFTTFVVYKGWEERGKALSQEKIISDLWRKFSEIREAEIAVLPPPSIRGLGQAGGFQIMIEDRGSLGLHELQQAVQDIIRAGESEPVLTRMHTTFSARSPQIYLDIDRTKAESLGLSLETVFATLQAFPGTSYVNLFNKFNQVFQVNVQADAPFRIDPEDLKNLYARNNRGEMVPLGTLMEARRILGSELVTRYNLYPAAPVFGGTTRGFSSGQGLKALEDLAGRTLPQGIGFDWTATAFQEKEVGLQAYFIYLLSITLVFMVLAALYESWTSPAAVIVTVPMAMVGVLLGLKLRNFDNNLYTQIGLVLMIALASKNAILIVEFARDLRHEGLSILDAAVEATRRRFRPIVMTSFAFILGVMPLLMASGAGAASRQAIGTVVFGGMLASTMLAIPFVPVFWVSLESWSEKRMARKRARLTK